MSSLKVMKTKPINLIFRYYITAAIDVPWAVDPTVVLYFSVVGLFDLNSIPNIGEPSEQTNSKVKMFALENLVLIDLISGCWMPLFLFWKCGYNC